MLYYMYLHDTVIINYNHSNMQAIVLSIFVKYFFMFGIILLTFKIFKFDIQYVYSLLEIIESLYKVNYLGGKLSNNIIYHHSTVNKQLNTYQ